MATPRRERTRGTGALRREIAVAFLFIVLAVAMTWPLAMNLQSAVSDPGDPFFSTWALDWDYHATIHGRPLFDAPIFFPSRDALAFSEHLYGIALLLFPLFAAGLAPLTIHNVAVLAAFAGCGYAAYALCRRLTRSTGASIIGGIAYAFVGYRFHHLPHLHFLWSLWLPLLLLALLALAEQPTIARAAALCAVFIFNGLSTLHWFAFGTFALLVTAIVVAAVNGLLTNARYWMLLAAATAIGLAVLMPFLLPYQRVASEYGMHRYSGDALPFSSAEWRDWLQPAWRSKLFGSLSPSAAYGHERTLLPGFGVYALAIVGLLGWRRGEESASIAPPPRRLLPILDSLCAVLLLATAAGAMAGSVAVPIGSLAFFICLAVRSWFRLPGAREASLRGLLSHLPTGLTVAILWILIGVLGAEGLHGMLDSFLFDYSSPFRSIRVPVRWAMIAYVGLAVVASAGAERLLRRLPTVRQSLTAIVIAAVLLLEFRVAPIRWYLVPRVAQPVYDWLRTAPFRGGVAEFPMTQAAAYEYLWHATVHHRPLINGVSSYSPPGYEAMAAMYASDPIPDNLLMELVRRHCSLIVVHDGLIQARSDAVRDWLRRGVASGQMVFVRRFDAGTRPDYVFALTSVEPNAVAWRERPTPDPAGFTPEQNAERFLAGDPLGYSSQIIANVDRGPGRFVRGVLDVSGWAASPAGIDHANIWLANRSLSVLAQRTDRGDVSAVLPWHPQVYGFSANIPKPPWWARGDTDVQVEIVDRRGQSRFMPPFWFRWTDRPLPRLAWNETALDDLLRRIGQDPIKTRPLIVEGRAGIEDYVDPLITDPDVVTDVEFIRQTASALFGKDPGPAVTDRYLRMLTRGTSRERVVQAFLRSGEFEKRYLRHAASR